MNKKIQSLINFILFACCIGTIVYSIIFRNEENRRKSYMEVNTITQQDKYIENTDVYNDFLMNYNSKGEVYYSFVELAGYDYPILLLSDGVYEDKNKQKAAMWTDIYYPVKNEITLFGNISSDGTAYPISANTTGIYTAGGHKMAKYSLDIENSKLKLIKKYIMFFHKTGKKADAISIEIIGNKNKIISQEEFNKAYEEYVNAKIIYFSPLFSITTKN